MAKFQDSTGREWVLTVDVVEIRRVREACSIHLGKIREVIELADDVEKLLDVVWVLIEPQAKAVKTGSVTREQFLRSMIGDCNPAAHDALAEAYLFFCPSRQAAAIREAMARMQSEENGSTTSSATPGSFAESAELTPTAPA
jgi:hypothetical protein